MYENYLAHHGVKGMHWGVRKKPETNPRYENDDSDIRQKRIEAVLNDKKHRKYLNGKDTSVKAELKFLEDANKAYSSKLFISGTSKSTTKDSGFYRRKLPKEVRKYLDVEMKKGTNVLIGDAPGIDTQVQDYLKKHKYDKVSVYTPSTGARYKANKNWNEHNIASEAPVGSKEWLAAKDKAMTDAATKGFAVTIEGGASATRKNIDRLKKQGKNVKQYEYSSKGRRRDRWI